MKRVALNLKLDDRPAPATDTSRLSAWRKALNLRASHSKQNAAPVIAFGQAARSLKVRAAGQTRIIEILVDSADPQFATDFANNLTSEFIEQNLESRWKTTEHTSEWLSRQLDDMRIKLERSDDALQAYARSTGLMFTGDKNSVSEEKLRQLQAVLSAAQSDRVSKQARYEMAKTSPPDALPDVLADESLNEYRTKLTELRRQIAELSSTYTPAHPKVKKVEAQVGTLENALHLEVAAILGRIKNDFEEAQGKERMIEADYEAQTKLVTGDAEKAIKYNILKREVDSDRQLYDAMLQQLKQATIASAMRASNVRVVDPANRPSRP